MTGQVVTDSRVVEFVEKHIHGRASHPCTAVGYMVGERVTIGAVFEKCNGPNVFMHGAAKDAVFTRGIMRKIFTHAFNALGVKRISTDTQSSNTKAIAWDLMAGFKEEGRRIGAAHDGSDVVMLVMWKEDCKWL